MHLLLSIVLLFANCSDNEATEDQESIALRKIVKVQQDRVTNELTFKDFQDTGVENLEEAKWRNYQFILLNRNDAVYKTFTISTITSLQELVDYSNEVVLPYERSREVLYKHWELKKAEFIDSEAAQNLSTYNTDKEVIYYESHILAIHKDGTFQEKPKNGSLWEGTFSMDEYYKSSPYKLLRIYFCTKTRNGMHLTQGGVYDCHRPHVEHIAYKNVVKLGENYLVLYSRNKAGEYYTYYEATKESNNHKEENYED